MTDRALAAKVVRRTGFGATGPAVDAVVNTGLSQYVWNLVAADPNADPGARLTPMPTFGDPGVDPSIHFEQNNTLTNWWIRRMVAVPQPFGEKLTFVWHSHFATSSQKAWYATEMARQNQKFRDLGRGDFRTLAYALLTDAALIDFLDGGLNVKGSPNENLSREFMELFTLGHGNGYTEQDVREAARALTGWRVNPDFTTWLDPTRHDSGTKTVLGRTGNLDAAGFVDAVLAQPASAGFVASRLWSHLVSDIPPDQATLGQLTAAYGPQRQLAPLLRALLTGSWFANARGTRVASPVEWVIGAVRALKFSVPDDTAAQKIQGWLWVLNQDPFQPPSVGGWPSGQLWLTTTAAETRFNCAMWLASQSDLSAISGSTTSRLNAVAYLLGVASWSNRTYNALKPAAGYPPLLVALALNSPENLTD